MDAGLVLEGRYRLDALLGTGGMGEVWQGTDLRLGRLVALKVMLDSWVRQPQALTRFLREGQAAAGLDHHPAIAAVHDVGEHDGHPFLVMELLRGETFQALMIRNPDGIPLHEVISYGIQIAEGLTAAHAAGVIHRDIKPANLMLLPSGLVKICDFGIARVETASVQLTGTGSAVGTPAYMAPEQWQGLPIDGRADLYSLGCVLYEMAIGRAAFRPGPRPVLSPAMEALLTSMLAADPAQRPASAAIVAATLRGSLDRRQRDAAMLQGRVLRLLAEAENIALTVDWDWRRASLFCEIAQIAVTLDADLARRLLGEAEIIASTDPDQWERENILKVMARLDLAEAGRILQSFTQPDEHDRQVRNVVNIAVAQAAAERDPGTARRLLVDTARIVRTITDPRAAGWRLQQIAKAAILRNPDTARQLLAEAEQIARALTDPAACSEDLRMIGQAMMALDGPEAKRLLSDAEQAARSVTQTDEQAKQILRIAEVTIGFDDDLTRRLVAEIEHLAAAASDAGLRDTLLEESAQAVADLDPGEAERITAAMADEKRRRFILWWMARDVAARDPSAALQLLAETVRQAQPAGDSVALREATAIMARIDPALAEQTARTIPDDGSHCEALRKLAEAVSTLEPQRARRLLAEAELFASRIWSQPQAAELSQIARLLVPLDISEAGRVLAEAERVARTIPSPWADRSDTAGTTIEIAKALAVTAPHEAERIAQRLDDYHRNGAILEVAKVISVKDTNDATRVIRVISDQDKQMQALADLAGYVASSDLSEAERIAGMISQPEHHARALMQVAEAAARQDPGWN